MFCYILIHPNKHSDYGQEDTEQNCMLFIRLLNTPLISFSACGTRCPFTSSPAQTCNYKQSLPSTSLDFCKCTTCCSSTSLFPTFSGFSHTWKASRGLDCIHMVVMQPNTNTLLKQIMFCKQIQITVGLLCFMKLVVKFYMASGWDWLKGVHWDWDPVGYNKKSCANRWEVFIFMSGWVDDISDIKFAG